MDSFFASLEQASNPALQNKPIAVIGQKERTVILTASYEARRYGIKTGMSKYEALKIYPNLILVVGNNKKYTFVSKKITDYLKTITDMVEVYSIDEAFMDISDLKINPRDLSYIIKTFIKINFKITCSIGIGSNKLIAKMASGYNKPDGYCFVDTKENISFIDNFKLEDIWGIGKKTVKKLNSKGIFNTKTIRLLGKTYMEKVFGKYGEKIYLMANGEYDSPVSNIPEKIKSIGHSMTLPENFTDYKICYDYILQLSEMISERARKYKISGKTINLYIRYSDFSKFSKQITIDYFTCSHKDIFSRAKYLFENNVDIKRGIRLIGISLTKLAYEYINIQNVENINQNWTNIYKAIDNINSKYSTNTITFASVLNCKRIGNKTISPAWRPDGIRFIDVS
jgi:DNA polymerase-4